MMMPVLLRLFAAFLLFASFGPATAAPSAEPLQVWFEPSAKKVMRDAQPRRGAGAGEMTAARNEDEACQIVLLARRDVGEVKVSATPLRRSLGTTPLEVKLYKVGYVTLPKDQVAYPDPLMALKPLALAANQAQPIWLSVRVPTNAVPGDYSGKIVVSVRDKQQQCPVHLRVWDFDLPATPACKTAFGINAEQIALYHNVDRNTTKGQMFSCGTELYAKYYDLLLDHKISGYSIPADLMSDAAAKYLNDPRLTSYLIPYMDPADVPGITDVLNIWQPTAGTITNADARLQQLLDHLVDGGWLAKGYFYRVDEPRTPQAYDKLVTIAERLRKFEPRARLLSAIHSDTGAGPTGALGRLKGSLSIWVPKSDCLDYCRGWREQLQHRRKAGEECWWYVCSGPGLPYNNLWLDLSAMNHRLLFWQQKREGIQGLLYYCVNSWSDTDRSVPWRKPAMYVDPNVTRYGDGCLVYPGSDIGVDGPVSSLRLEIIRDGIEDFDYLTMAERLLGPEATSAYVNRLVKTLTKYEENPSELESVRRALGEALEKATLAARS
jgi:hypothetical protein